MFNQKKLRALTQTPGDNNKHRGSESVVVIGVNRDKKNSTFYLTVKSFSLKKSIKLVIRKGC